VPAKPKRLKISGKQLKALQRRIRCRELDDDDYELLQGLAETVECLSQALAEKDISIGRLCKYLLGAPTETARNILRRIRKAREKAGDSTGQQPPAGAAPPEGKPPKGHGRTPAAAYPDADKVVIGHPGLGSGDRCPGCEKGKLYELSMPSVFVQVIGQAPLKATVYERTRLRCNLCGEVLTPRLPENVGDKKHDESAAAMVAVLKYGCGLPLNRLEKLQANLKNPVAASTQWDILNAAAITVAPVFDALVEQAAQGELLHNDDTTARVLSFLNDPPGERTGIFTTGIVSRRQDRTIALFATGDRHAGENLTRLLARRNTGLPPPIQMCDALSRNASKDFDTIMANCLTHARRQFVEIVDRFPDDCAHVIEQLGKVYHNDAIAKEGKLSPEERMLCHQRESGPVMDALHAWCTRQIEEKSVEPNSGLGKAMNYLLKRWNKLTRFLEVPGAPLDNNICERALKFAILHRKNALFFKTRRGAHVGDLFMSLIHTCQLAGVNPLEYITWLLKNAAGLQRSPKDYLPWMFSP
jgi:transposase